MACWWFDADRDGAVQARRADSKTITALLSQFADRWIWRWLTAGDLGIGRNFAAGWTLEYSRFIGSLFNYWGSIGVSLGYIAIIMLIAQSGRGQRIIEPFAAVGRMALSNYLFQTVAATLIFYGHGLGLFGQVERSGQLLIVLGIWSVQLIVSPLWLRYFHFGPAEWLWRSLTYGKLQPMKLGQPVAATVPN